MSRRRLGSPGGGGGGLQAPGWRSIGRGLSQWCCGAGSGWCTGFGGAAAGMAVFASLAVAVMAAAVRLGIEGFLLLWCQRRVESLGGFAPAVCLGRALCTQGAHAVNAFGRGELLHVLAIHSGVALAR